MILTDFQDTYSEIYSTRSGADRGTLFQIRNAFNHKNVCGKVMKSFNHNADLLRFTTECLSALLAMQLVLADIPDSDEDKDQHLLDPQPIVEMVRQQVSLNM